MKKILHRYYYVLFLFLVLPGSVLAQGFVIDDIRVEGLQRLTPGTIFNYLPVEVGDTFTDQISLEAVRSLFKTGFFDDVKLERDGNVLVVIVKERPAIGSLEISGNKDIKTEDIMENLEQVGFAEGRVFDQSQLDTLERELRRVYESQGKYGMKIDSTVTPLGNNRVAVAVEISEGKAARIKEINIIGNKSFKEKVLLELFELSEPTLLSFFTKNNQYSRQKLSADLESLRSHYLNNGYVNFNIDSTQVTITPDKVDMYITINITEGAQYTVSGVKLAGELILPEQVLFPLIFINRGSLYSHRQVTGSSEAITQRLGHEGYAFANVNAIPDIDEDNKTVSITFFVDPGKRTYVRRINYIGNNRTRDEVLRREMRQQEGSWISTPNVDRGKIRLQRLGYFEEVNVETPAVAGTTDQVDVNYSVEEKAFGNFVAGLGFSQTQGLIIQTSITQDNFLGSGKRIQFAFNNSDVNRVFGLSYTNPYYTIDGISRTISVNFQETQGLDANITAFDSRVFGGGFNFAVPISEFNSIFVGLNYENTKLSEDGFFAQEVDDFIKREGAEFDILRLSAGFGYDTRNKAIFPDRGTSHRISAEISLPSLGSSLEFFKVAYKAQYFLPLFRRLVFSLKGDFAYGDSFDDSDGLPFFENFYAGGPRSVRGFEENTLGPRDNFGRPIGGNVKIVGGAELIFPLPFIEKAADSVRVTAFVDAGNIYGFDSIFDVNGQFIGRDRQDIDLGNIRYSVGFGGTWLSPFGMVSASIAKPFNEQPGDETQQFQFNFGTSF